MPTVPRRLAGLQVAASFALLAYRGVSKASIAGLVRSDHSEAEDVFGRPELEKTFRGWVQPRVKGHHAVFHVHIPKVAGVSLIEDLRKRLPSKVGLFSTEACWRQVVTNDPTLRDAWNKPIIDARFGENDLDQVITMVRHPESHVLSQYHQCSDTIWGRGQMHQTQLHLLANFSTWISHFAKQADVFMRAPHSSTLMVHGSTGCYHPFNMQTRAFTCRSRLHDVEENYLVEQALNRLDRTYFVGVVEFYQESVCVYLAKTLLKVPAYCNCTDRQAWNSFRGTHDDHGYAGVQPHTVHSLLDEDKKMIREVTQDDFALYNRAKKRLRDELQQQEARHGVKILCPEARAKLEAIA